jgi:DNA ligase-1
MTDRVEQNLPPLCRFAADGALTVWIIEAVGTEVVTVWGQAGGKYQEARYQCTPKNVGQKNATTSEWQAANEALAEWTKQKKKKGYRETVDEARAVLQDFRPMLAHRYEDHLAKLTWPVIVQPKLDGLRCLAFRTTEGGPVTLQSRGNDPIVLPHIQEQLRQVLQPGEMLDGELYVHGTGLQTINSWVRRAQEDSKQIEYHCYDFVTPRTRTAPWKVRIVELSDLMNGPVQMKRLTHIKHVPSQWCNDDKQVHFAHDRHILEGYEGAIIRTTEGVYGMGKRSPDLLKLKAFKDAEFRITGHTVGLGKFAQVPIFHCVTADGKAFDCTPRGTAAARAELLAVAGEAVGAMLTVRYFDETDDHIPRFPVGISIRYEGT